ncbi:MAG: hypothetical protein QM733_14860 [Ilumatobacteraceae bacterium]
MSTVVSDDARGDAEQSAAAFRALHALRIKGFAKVEVIAEIADVPVGEAREHLVAFEAAEVVSFREARALWQLTSAGRDEHARLLAADVAGVVDGELGRPYVAFLALNEEMKTLCGRWQLRDGEINDHRDHGYDAAVVAAVADLQDRAAPVVRRLADVLPRLAPYERRLGQACQRFVRGETNMFTGVMCGSYHDVWMELHEDLILSQGIERAAEGSF